MAGVMQNRRGRSEFSTLGRYSADARFSKTSSLHNAFSSTSLPFKLPTAFCDLLRSSPPPLPPSLLRSSADVGLGNHLRKKDLVGNGRVKVLLRVCPASALADRSISTDQPSESRHSPSQDNILSVDGIRKHVTIFNSATGLRTAHERVGVSAPKVYAFDSVFPETSSQAEINAVGLVDVIHALFQGADGAVFCYGQAGLGKTCSLIGSDENVRELGMIPCALSWLFRYIEYMKKKTNRRYSVRVSAIEIHGRSERLRDLLRDLANEDAPAEDICVMEDPIYGTQLKNLCELRVSTAHKAAYMLDFALAQRTSSGPRASEEARRHSHMVYTLHLHQYELNSSTSSGIALGRSRLHFIDLGSCERTLMKTPHSLTLSLNSLGHVIMAIINNSKHVPFKESKLTLVLQELLGNFNCRTVMLAHVADGKRNYADTLSTIQMASRIHRVITKKKIRSSNRGGLPDGMNMAKCVANSQSTKSDDELRGASSGVGETSGSEMSCDTVIYVRPNGVAYSDRELTDNEGSLRSESVYTPPETPDKVSENVIRRSQTTRIPHSVNDTPSNHRNIESQNTIKKRVARVVGVAVPMNQVIRHESDDTGEGTLSKPPRRTEHSANYRRTEIKRDMKDVRCKSMSLESCGSGKRVRSKIPPPPPRRSSSIRVATVSPNKDLKRSENSPKIINKSDHRRYSCRLSRTEAQTLQRESIRQPEEYDVASRGSSRRAKRGNSVANLSYSDVIICDSPKKELESCIERLSNVVKFMENDEVIGSSAVENEEYGTDTSVITDEQFSDGGDELGQVLKNSRRKFDTVDRAGRALNSGKRYSARVTNIAPSCFAYEETNQVKKSLKHSRTFNVDPNLSMSSSSDNTEASLPSEPSASDIPEPGNTELTKENLVCVGASLVSVKSSDVTLYDSSSLEMNYSRSDYHNSNSIVDPRAKQSAKLSRKDYANRAAKQTPDKNVVISGSEVNGGPHLSLIKGGDSSTLELVVTSSSAVTAQYSNNPICASNTAPIKSKSKWGIKRFSSSKKQKTKSGHPTTQEQVENHTIERLKNAADNHSFVSKLLSPKVKRGARKSDANYTLPTQSSCGKSMERKSKRTKTPNRVDVKAKDINLKSSASSSGKSAASRKKKAG